MKARFAGLLAVAGLLLPALTHAAEIYLVARAEGQGNAVTNYPPPSASYSTGVTHDQNDPLDFSSASASGSLADWTLRLRVDTFGNSANSQASVGLIDKLTFSLPASMPTATVTVFMDIDGSDGGEGAKQGTASLNFSGQVDQTNWPSGGNIFRTYSVTLDVSNGQSYPLNASIGASLAGRGAGTEVDPRETAFIDMANTARVSIIVPAGVTYTTESGYQLPVRGLTSFTLNSPTVAGCKNVTGKVTLSQPAPATGTVVTISDTLASATAPLSVTVPAGATTKSVSIKTVPVAASESGIVSATVDSTTLTQTLTVRPIGPLSVSLTPTSVVGSQPVSGTVKLECDAAPGPVSVDLSSSNAAVASPVAASIVVPQGLQSANFDVTTNAVQTKSYATISGAANGITKSKKLTVNMAAAVSPISIKFGSVAVGQTSAPLNATLTNKGSVPFSVNSISLTGTAATWFAQTNSCPASLDPGASCTISVTITPQAAATKSAKLSISTTATSTALSVSVTGTGI